MQFVSAQTTASFLELASRKQEKCWIDLGRDWVVILLRTITSV